MAEPRRATPTLGCLNEHGPINATADTLGDNPDYVEVRVRERPE